MPQLAELQNEFGAAIQDAGREVPRAVTSHTARHPTRRFNVYRNNFYAGLIDVLAGRFPVVTRLVGEEFFRAMARVYVEQNPPRSPMLIEYAGDFADFLADFEPVQDVPYLPDIARLEWAWHCAYYAADSKPLTGGELAGLPQERLTETRFDLHPSLGVVQSRFPIVAIWKTNRFDKDVCPVDIAAGGEDALVTRPKLNVEVRRLPAGAAAFIAALKQGDTFSQAYSAALASAPEFELSMNIAGLIQAGAIVGYRYG